MLQIIIADDEKTIREGMARLVNSFNLPLEIVALAKDGKQTLEFVEKFHPDLLIVDINMPYLNGLETIEAIRKDRKEMKIIIVSGYDNFSYAQKAMELGVFSYLLKPLDMQKFKEVLESAINGYEKRLLEINLLNKHGYHEEKQASADEIKTYMKTHYGSAELSLNAMADYFNVSSSTMAKMVKKRTGMNFSEYLNSLRLEAAENLLKESELTINEISLIVGYSSQHYFSRIFKKYKEVSPETYRKSVKKI